MNGLNLKKGMVLNLQKADSQLTNIILGVEWGTLERKEGLFKPAGLIDVNLDLSVTLLNANKDEVDTVYFGNLSTIGIQHIVDEFVWDEESDERDNERIIINLNKIDSSVEYIVAHLVSFSNDPLDKLPYATARVYNSDNNEEKLAEFKLSEMGEFKGKKGVLLGVFYKT